MWIGYRSARDAHGPCPTRKYVHPPHTRAPLMSRSYTGNKCPALVLRFLDNIESHVPLPLHNSNRNPNPNPNPYTRSHTHPRTHTHTPLPIAQSHAYGQQMSRTEVLRFLKISDQMYHHHYGEPAPQSGRLQRVLKRLAPAVVVKLRLVWLIGWLVGGFVGWLFGCLVGRSVSWLFGCLAV